MGKINLDTVRLPIIKVSNQVATSMQELRHLAMEFSEYEDLKNDTLVRGLTAFLASGDEQVETRVVGKIEVPTTWWDAFKERWLPWLGWNTTKHSIIMETKRITKICPHLATSKTQHHLEFLVRDPDLGA